MDVVIPAQSTLQRGQYLSNGRFSLAFTAEGQLVRHDLAHSSSELLWDGSGLPDLSELRLRNRVLEAVGSGDPLVLGDVPSAASSLQLDENGNLFYVTPGSADEDPVQLQPVAAFPPLLLKPRLVPQGPWAFCQGLVKHRAWAWQLIAALLLGVSIWLAVWAIFHVPANEAPATGLMILSAVAFGLGASLWAVLQRSGGRVMLVCLLAVALLVVFAYSTLSINLPAAARAFSGEKEGLAFDIAKQNIAGARAQAFATLCLGFAVLSVMFVLPLAGGVTLTQVLSPATTSASTVLVLWTFIVVYAVALLGGYQLLMGGAFACADNNAIYCAKGDAFSYLILLGVPGAAAALTKTATPAAPAASASEASVSEVSEAQYFIFNLIAMAFVAFSLLRDNHRLPELPELLLALTGASALAYTLEKRTPKPANAG